MKNYGVLVFALAALSAAAQSPATTPVTNSYMQVNLVSDIAGTAQSTDPKLVNPWGLSRPASVSAKEAHWWASDQKTGVSTLYDANAAIDALIVTIPPASGTGPGSPTGTVANGVNFIFATLDGTIAEWLAATGPPQPSFIHPASGTCTNCHTTSAVQKVNHASTGAVYTGVTLGSYNGASTYYVANAAGGVEAYDANFNPVTLPAGAFTDPNIPAGFTPYGIQSADKEIVVTYAPAPPANGGYVDIFTTAGKLVVTLQNGTWFDQPWGVAQAPSTFGAFSSALLIGNTGSGQIAAFNPKTGKYLGILDNASREPLANPGLWAISFGAGNTDSGPANTLYFNVGIQNFAHGLFGAITAN